MGEFFSWNSEIPKTEISFFMAILAIFCQKTDNSGQKLMKNVQEYTYMQFERWQEGNKLERLGSARSLKKSNFPALFSNLIRTNFSKIPADPSLSTIFLGYAKT